MGRYFSPSRPLELRAELRRDVGARERVGDIGGEEADLGAAVEAAAFELQAVERLRARERDHGVGELDLAAGAGCLLFQNVEDLRLQDVAAGDGSGSTAPRSRFGFSTILVIAKALPLGLPTPTTPYMCDAVRRHFLDRDDVGVVVERLGGVDHLREAAALVLHQHVGQQQRERLVADQFARAPDRMAEAERRLLAGEARRARLRQIAADSSARSAFLPRSVSVISSSNWRSKWSSMTPLLRPVTKMKCSMPASRASSTTCWISGRSTTGSISFGMALVAGRKRVPRPATGKDGFADAVHAEPDRRLPRVDVGQAKQKAWRRPQVQIVRTSRINAVETISGAPIGRQRVASDRREAVIGNASIHRDASWPRPCWPLAWRCRASAQAQRRRAIRRRHRRDPAGCRRRPAGAGMERRIGRLRPSAA